MKLPGGIWLRALVSTGIMVLLLAFLVDWRQALAAFANARWEYFGLLALWITADRLMMSYKWTVLIKARGMAISQATALRSYYLGTFAGCFLPSTVGGDAVRVGAVASTGRPSHELAASVLMERALGFVAAGLFALLAMLLLVGLVGGLPRQVMVWALALPGVSILLVLASFSGAAAGFMERAAVWLQERGRLAGWAGRFLSAYSAYRRHGKALAWFTLLSFVEQVVPPVGTWLAALALNINLPLLTAFAVAPVALLFTRIPVSVSGFGVVEGLYVAFFAMVGVGATESFLLGLVANLSIVVATAPGAVLFYVGDWGREAGPGAGEDTRQNK